MMDVYDPISDLEEQSGLDIEVTKSLPYKVDLTRAESIVPLDEHEDSGSGNRSNLMYVAEMNGLDNVYVSLVESDVHDETFSTTTEDAYRMMVGVQAADYIIKHANVRGVETPVMEYDEGGGYVVSSAVDGDSLMSHELTDEMVDSWVNAAAVALLIGDTDFHYNNILTTGERVFMFDFDRAGYNLASNTALNDEAWRQILSSAKYMGYRNDMESAEERIRERATEIAQQLGRHIRVRESYGHRLENYVANIESNIEAAASGRL